MSTTDNPSNILSEAPLVGIVVEDVEIKNVGDDNEKKVTVEPAALSDKEELLAYACKTYCRRPNYLVPETLKDPNDDGQTKLADYVLPMGSVWQDSDPNHRFMCLNHRFVTLQTKDAKGVGSAHIYFVPRNIPLPKDLFPGRGLEGYYNDDTMTANAQKWLDKNAEFSVGGGYRIIGTNTIDRADVVL
jgi:hypothetical protein